MQTYNQNSFKGGMQAFFDSLKQPPETYPLLVNGRNRDNVIRPVKAPRKETLPDGKKQGLYAVGRYLIAFVAGRAYVADASGTTSWEIVPGFQMSDSVDLIHFIAVPGSTVNFKKDFTNNVFTTTPISGSTPVGLAFDGETQPNVVFPYEGGVRARVTNSYGAWLPSENATEPDKREYVPIGKFPLWHGNRLYIVAKDANGAWTVIMRSVTGRPLDFMVNIKGDGTAGGDAFTVAHAVSHEDITGLFATPSEAFVASTLTNSYLVTPIDTPEERRFMEPVFENAALFPSGAVGHYAAVDIGGDFCVITQSGVHSFNAVMQLRRESQNLPFSKPIWKYLNRPLAYGAAVRHDDYALFAVDTSFGPGVLVYDTTVESWAGIDLYRNVGAIKQFAETVSEGKRRLWFCTADGVYEAFASANYETCRFYIGDFNSQSAKTCVQNPSYTFLFRDVYETAEVCLRHFVDRAECETMVGTLPTTSANSATYPATVPYDSDGGRAVRQINFDPSLNKLGFAFGAELSWVSGAALSMLTVEAAQDNADASLLNQEAGILGANPDIGEISLGIFGGALLNGPHQALVQQMNKARYDAIVGTGDHFIGDGDDATAFNLWPAATRKYFVPGTSDLLGTAFWKHFPKQNYRHVRLGPCSLFMLNTSYGMDEDATAAQQIWLAATLRASTSRFNIVVLYVSPYTSAQGEAPGAYAWRLPYKSWGAHLLISGRSHVYERFAIDGLPAIVIGSGAETSAESSVTSVRGREAFKSAIGHVKLYANATKLTTEFIDLTGAVYDRHTILT